MKEREYIVEYDQFFAIIFEKRSVTSCSEDLVLATVCSSSKGSPRLYHDPIAKAINWLATNILYSYIQLLHIYTRI